MTFGVPPSCHPMVCAAERGECLSDTQLDMRREDETPKEIMPSHDTAHLKGSKHEGFP